MRTIPISSNKINNLSHSENMLFKLHFLQEIWNADQIKESMPGVRNSYLIIVIQLSF